MTSVLTPAPVQAPAGPAAPPRRSPWRRFAGGLRAWLRGTPGSLRVALVLSVLAGIGFGLLAGQAFLIRAQALEDAQSGTAQVVRVEGIRTDLMEADARSVDAFLGLLIDQELPPGQQVQYEYALHRVFRQLALAASEPQDAPGLAVANRWAAQYLRVSAQAAEGRDPRRVADASALLRNQVLPVLEGVHQGDTRRVGEAYSRSRDATPLLLTAGIAAIILLLGVQLWLAARTHRLINLPSAAGLLTVLVVLLGGTLAMQWAQSRAEDVRATSYAATEAAVRARAAAFDARSEEGRSLLGSGGPAADDGWQAAARQVRAGLAEAGNTLGRDEVNAAGKAFDVYAARHFEIRVKAAADLDGAREQSVTPAPRGGVGSFEDFDNVTAQFLTVQQRKMSDGLAAPHAVLVGGAWLGLACGLAAAALGLAGLTRRLAEYR